MADPVPAEVQPESDIYTALVIVATVFLATGTAYVSVRALALFGTWVPF